MEIYFCLLQRDIKVQIAAVWTHITSIKQMKIRSDKPFIIPTLGKFLEIKKRNKGKGEKPDYKERQNDQIRGCSSSNTTPAPPHVSVSPHYKPEQQNITLLFYDTK